MITGRNSNQITFDVHHDENENNSAEKAGTLPPSEIKMNLDNKAMKAEMKAVESDWSYSSLGDICYILVYIAPDSTILKKMQSSVCQ